MDSGPQCRRVAEEAESCWTSGLGHAAPANPPVFKLGVGATGLPAKMHMSLGVTSNSLMFP